MALLQMVRVELGEVGILPGSVKMVSTDNLATITTAGYLNGVGNQLATVNLAPTDVIECLYSYDNVTGSCSYAAFKPSISGGVITLVQAGGGSVTPAALTRVDDTNVTLTLGGTPATALLQATSLTLGWTGQLSLARGGTNKNITSDNGAIVYCDSDSFELLASTATAGQILRSGSSSAPSWSTATYPATAGTSGNVLTSDGTNWVSGSPPVVLGNFQQNFLVGGM